MPVQDIADLIKAHRVRERLSQSDFARRCGLSAGTVGKLELAAVKPDLDSLIKLGTGLGRRPVDLLYIYAGMPLPAISTGSSDLPPEILAIANDPDLDDKPISDVARQGIRAVMQFVVMMENSLHSEPLALPKQIAVGAATGPPAPSGVAPEQAAPAEGRVEVAIPAAGPIDTEQILVAAFQALCSQNQPSPSKKLLERVVQGLPGAGALTTAEFEALLGRDHARFRRLKAPGWWGLEEWPDANYIGYWMMESRLMAGE